MRFSFCVSYFRVAIVAFLLHEAPFANAANGTRDFDGPDVVFYWADQWIEYNPLDCPACDWHQMWPDSGAYSRSPRFSGNMPGLGYPYHKALIAGVNDTLIVSISMSNSHHTKPYSLVGKQIKDWYSPKVYQLFVTDSSGPKFRDSSQLGFGIRNWYDGSGPISEPDTIPAWSDRFWVTFNVWGLPEGRFQICFSPTDSVPGDFVAISGGYVFEYYPAQSLADTVNAYEACYLRMEEDKNFTAADSWADSILIVHPTSVPGWTLKASSLLALNDTSGAKSAYDTAIDILQNGKDPLMPDSTARPLTPAEENYVEWITVILDYNLKSLGP